MKFLPYLRILTYAMIVAIAFMCGRTTYFIPVNLSRPHTDSPGPWPSVEDIAMWRGKDDAWLRKNLGEPMWEHGIKLPVPDIGVFQGVQTKLEKEYPKYIGGMKSLIWEKGPRSFQVFMIRPADAWLVLDAVSWQEGVQF